MASRTNKDVVRTFNEQVIAAGDADVFHQLMSADFVNHSAPPGSPAGADGMWNTFQNVLRPALSDMQVVIHDQIAENDKVVTRKTITGKHTGALMGIAPSGQDIAIDVIDIVRLENGRYAEHWGVNTLFGVLAQLRASNL